MNDLIIDCYVDYFRQGQCAIVSSINDTNDWKTVKNALQVINTDEINTKVSRTDLNFLSHLLVWLYLYYMYSLQHLFEIIASVLHLGNVHFDSDDKGHALLNNKAELHWVSNVGKNSHGYFTDITEKGNQCNVFSSCSY